MGDDDEIPFEEFLDVFEGEEIQKDTGRDFHSLTQLLKEYSELKKHYRTSPYLSKFEKTRILSERAQQITNGAPIFVEGEFTDTYSIAVKELEERKLPFIIRRPYGNTYEYWKVRDLR
jgi:DNA-directed RNA polymerase subunit K/omega